MKYFKLLLPLLLFGVWITPASAQKPEKSPFKRGAGMFEYTGYEPLKEKPVTVFYYIPTRGSIKKMPVLFSMHGAERNGLVQRGVWRNLAEEYGFIVIAPQFTHKNGYDENGYQFGGVSQTPRRFMPRPAEQWTYAIIEALFDYFKSCTGNVNETYDMFGHSAGGQFVHRYLTAMPHARVRRAVAANPGNYAYPDPDSPLANDEGLQASIQTWPYSVQGTPFATDENLAALFKRNLIILIGTQDIEPVKNSVEADNPMRIQGLTRYERAWRYFRHAQQVAMKKKMTFNWKIMEVPGAEHNSGQMVHGQHNARWSVINGNEKVYNTSDVTNFGAFHILFDE